MIGLARMAQPRIIATEDLLAALRPAGQRAEFAGRVLNLSAGGTLIAGSGFEGGESLGVDSRAPTFDLPAKVRWCTARADQWACAWSSWEYDLAVRGSRRWRTRLNAAAAIYAQACGRLVDRLALADGHLPTAASADGQRVSAWRS